MNYKLAKSLATVIIIFALFLLFYQRSLYNNFSEKTPPMSAYYTRLTVSPHHLSSSAPSKAPSKAPSLLVADNTKLEDSEAEEHQLQYSHAQMVYFAREQYKQNTRLFIPSRYTSHTTSFDNLFLKRTNRFDVRGHDVMVFIHIQKTDGTTFEQWLALELDVERPCRCSPSNKNRVYCDCLRPNSHRKRWIFFRFEKMFSWECGVHADYTELAVSGCVDQVMDVKEGRSVKRRYFYFTLLRNPIDRFLSEYRHVLRGASWKESIFVCNGKRPSPELLPFCFNPQKYDWDFTELDDFITCPYNMALNRYLLWLFDRQTRMLADLTLVNCYNTTAMEPWKRDFLMLESAKHNLRQIAFFGIVERMNETQYMFERTFGMKFKKPIPMRDSPRMFLSDTQRDLINKANHLDIKLYKYAYDLFEQRVRRAALY